MEFEDRNPKPEPPNSTTPTAVLAILIVLVCVLLYVGWQMMSDESNSSSELAAEEMVVPKTTDSVVVDEDDMKDQKTEVSSPEVAKTEEKTSETVASDAKAEEKKEEKISEPVAIKGETAKYTVKSGETFFGIANKFNVSASTMKKLNPGVDPEGIKVGVTKLTVPVQAVHTVGPGDILRVVAIKYGISVEQLMAANGKTKNFSERGEKLLIPKKEKE